MADRQLNRSNSSHRGAEHIGLATSESQLLPGVREQIVRRLFIVVEVLQNKLPRLLHNHAAGEILPEGGALDRSTKGHLSALPCRRAMLSTGRLGSTIGST